MAYQERTPSTKRTLVSVNELRGKIFTSVGQDDCGLMLANDTEFYRFCYVSRGYCPDTGIHSIRGKIGLLTREPLDVQKIAVRKGEQFEDFKATRSIDVSTIEDCFQFSTSRGTVDIEYQRVNDVQGFPVFIKCGSREDTLVRWSVDVPIPIEYCGTSNNPRNGHNMVARTQWMDDLQKPGKNDWGYVPTIIAKRCVVSDDYINEYMEDNMRRIKEEGLWEPPADFNFNF